MLKHSDVVRYLLDRGLLHSQDVVDGAVVVRDASSRNHIFVVDADDTSFVLKQGMSQEGVTAVAHEAAVYRMLGQLGDRMTKYLPAVWEYDAIGQVLDSGENARRSGSPGHTSSAPAAFHGRSPRRSAMPWGTLHRDDSGQHRYPRRRRSARHHGFSSVHQPHLSIFRDASSAALELIRIVQSAPELCDRLDALRREWEPSCLIHRDVKWDNLIACPETSRPKSGFRLKIIDWEAAQTGDPRWDLGSVFSHYLSLWLFSIPITGQDPPERFPELARFPLARMQPAMADCWSAYRRRADLDQADAQWLSAVVSFAAARLVQTAFEAAQTASHLDSGMVLHLQLASNMLSRPLEAAVHLLGIPVEARR